jgi:hypothetical protein
MMNNVNKKPTLDEFDQTFTCRAGGPIPPFPFPPSMQRKADKLSQISQRNHPEGLPIASLDFDLHSAPSIDVTLRKMVDE